VLFGKAEAAGVGIVVRLPLNSGMLSGKLRKDSSFAESDHRNYNRNGEAFSVGETFGGVPYEKGLDLVETLRPMCPAGWSMAEFAQRFILDFPAVTTVITGASRPEQVTTNANASRLAPLPEATHRSLAGLYDRKIESLIRCDH
jgi:aryl-alcohol dehydrogenase-like predicted oxidoreductase